MKKEDKQKIYNIVDSVKGGCGKTTLSIWLASFLQKEGSTTIEEKACIIDMDLQGSCMVNLFHGSADGEQHYEYLHDLVRGYKIKGKKYIQDLKVRDREFSVVFTSPEQKDKRLFCSDSKSNYSPAMEYGTFRLGIKSFLKGDVFKKRNFKHVIFDMPPNADGYSDAVLECVLNPKYSVVDTKTKDRVNLFMVTTLDISHTQATISSIEEIYTEVSNNVPDRLFIVFNNNIVTKRTESEFIEFCNTRRIIIQNALRRVFISEDQRKNVYFCIMNQNIEYADACSEGIGLLNSMKDLQLEQCPFYKYAIYGDSEFQDMTPDLLRKLMIGEGHEHKNK